MSCRGGVGRAPDIWSDAVEESIITAHGPAQRKKGGTELLSGHGHRFHVAARRHKSVIGELDGTVLGLGHDKSSASKRHGNGYGCPDYFCFHGGGSGTIHKLMSQFQQPGNPVTYDRTQ